MTEQLFPELETDTRKMILAHISKLRIKHSLLADELNVSKNHIKEILKCRRTLSEENLKKINQVLGTSFGNEQKK